MQERRVTPQKQGGFGLVELLVSVSIIVFITSLVLVQHGAFNASVLLRSQAYEIALQAREVQLFAVSAIGEGGNFRNRYGLHFNTADSAHHTYRIFRDSDDNNYYSGMSEEFGNQGFLDERFEIRDIRPQGDTLSGTELSVIFERPNFDARFFDSDGEVNATSVLIDVARRGQTGTGPGVIRTIEISQTGQISVQ